MVLLAAYQVLLHRYSGQDEILVGSPTSGRSFSESSAIVGYFVNPIVLRARIDGGRSFREYLGTVRQVALGALEHQDFPFPVLVERLRVPRQANRSPLFQALFALQRPQMLADVVNLLSGDENQNTLDWGGLRLEPFDLAQQEGQFEISLELMETGQSIYALLKYQTDLFDAETIAGLSRHYCNLLEEIVDDSDRPVCDLPLADDDERRGVLATFNQTDTAYPREQTIHRLFEIRAERHPDHVALVFGQGQVTYGELNARANQLAHHLRTIGVGPEVKVGICIERSVEMIVSLLAILKAGGAYVPLDPDYPSRRLEFMSEDSGASILIASQRTADLFLDFDGDLVFVDQDAEQIAASSSDNLGLETAADGLAYVMYTSGSTGTPKGVEVVHRGVIRLVCNTDYVELGPEQVVLQFAPLSFDASTFEIWGPLLNGGRLAIFPPGLPSIDELGRFIRDHHVNTLWLTAGLFHQMVDFGLEYLHGVRQLLAGGDVVSPAHAKKALEALADCRLINGYGPTENTTFTCCHVMHSPADVGSTVSIGRPIANTRVYVLDRYGKPVPVGVPGELYAAGDGLARGYLNGPQLTQERFLPDPFVEDGEARMYGTGDLVRWRSDGSLMFLGRRDHQVKIRGFRIELGEIESALTGHNAVRSAVVVARKDHDDEQRLVAYVAPSADPPPSVDELRGFLKKRVPSYMIPSAVVILDELPLTANGKIDRSALPSVARSRSTMQAEYAAPRTPIEKAMAAIWAEVLGLDRVGIHDNFFDLGGASIKSLRIVAKAQEAGLTLDPSVLSPELLFEHPTVAEVAALIESAAPHQSHAEKEEN
jgi:aspartate racemase